MSAYDAFAAVYERCAPGMTEDVPFSIELARERRRGRRRRTEFVWVTRKPA